ncbi:biopolymer transporter ExbD [bacterium]|nr:biopolymer transporter ExbD [bacterium]
MAAPKKRRIPVVIDMTPMVDIAFLLLIFFMSTTVFKKPEDVSVQVPTSHSINQLPETGIIVITITKPTYNADGTVKEESAILMTLNDVALDVDNKMRVLKGAHSSEPIKFKADEIVPIIEKLMLKRLVNKVVLKGDRDADYGAVESVMETLQKNDLLFVNLVTDLEDS